jgi:BolA protein
MLLRDRIITILTKELTPLYLDVTDFSESHRGHAGYKEGGETHFNVVVVSDIFSDKSTIARHKLIYGLLEQEIKTHIHALTLKTLTPLEAEKRETFNS